MLSSGFVGNVIDVKDRHINICFLINHNTCLWIQKGLRSFSQVLSTWH